MTPLWATLTVYGSHHKTELIHWAAKGNLNRISTDPELARGILKWSRSRSRWWFVPVNGQGNTAIHQHHRDDGSGDGVEVHKLVQRNGYLLAIIIGHAAPSSTLQCCTAAGRPRPITLIDYSNFILCSYRNRFVLLGMIGSFECKAEGEWTEMRMLRVLAAIEHDVNVAKRYCWGRKSNFVFHIHSFFWMK